MTKTEQAFRVQTILKHMKFQTKNSTNAIFPIGVVKPNGVVTALDLNSDVRFSPPMLTWQVFPLVM